MKLIRYDGVILALLAQPAWRSQSYAESLPSDYVLQMRPVVYSEGLLTEANIVRSDGYEVLLEMALAEAERLDLQPVVLRRELSAPGGYGTNMVELMADGDIRHAWRNRGFYPIILLTTPNSLAWTDEYLSSLMANESVRFETQEEHEYSSEVSTRLRSFLAGDDEEIGDRKK